LSDLADFEARTTTGKAEEAKALLSSLAPLPGSYIQTESPIAVGPLCGEYLRGVYGRDGNVDTTEGLKVSISPGVVLRNTAPTLAKQLFTLAIKTELEEAVEAKKAWETAIVRLEHARRSGQMKLAGELASEVLSLRAEYDREQMEAENAVKQIRFTMADQTG